MMGQIDADFKKRFKDIHKGAADIVADEARRPVSYTHLTLPTIYSV